ncbi:unnamed protein product [Caenorhabditis sp. 36 PRJEB53466]|nr:unnamed protein product [Caenorhabditis sp. 36 PRJEB53466]
MKRLLFFCVLGATVLFGDAIIMERRGSSYSGHDFSSSSSSSEPSDSSEKDHDGTRIGKHHHHHHRYAAKPDETTPPRGPKRCEDGWTTFYRRPTNWCVKIFVAQGAYDAGQTFCSQYSAVLTGLQNGAERLVLADLALPFVISSGATYGSTWLGAKRTGPGVSFAWTDGYTNGTEGFHFGPAQPDGALRNGIPQSCVQQFIITPAWRGNPGWYQADLDDWDCDVSTRAPLYRLFACGKKASVD